MMNHQLSADCVKNTLEDLILADKSIEEVTKALVENSVTYSGAFMRACTREEVLDALVQAVKEHEPFKIFLKY